jgi:hypothetical protein
MVARLFRSVCARVALIDKRDLDMPPRASAH